MPLEMDARELFKPQRLGIFRIGHALPLDTQAHASTVNQLVSDLEDMGLDATLVDPVSRLVDRLGKVDIAQVPPIQV